MNSSYVSNSNFDKIEQAAVGVITGFMVFALCLERGFKVFQRLRRMIESPLPSTSSSQESSLEKLDREMEMSLKEKD
jgi:hypothetical protein